MERIRYRPDTGIDGGTGAEWPLPNVAPLVDGSSRSSCARLGALVGLGHFAWAIRIGIDHPAAAYWPDLVANWIYFERLLAGDQSLGRMWYFPAPKILLIALLGPLTDSFGAVLIVALAAAVLSGASAYLVARVAGPTAGALIGAVLAFDPLWTSLVAIGSADLFLWSMTTACVALWEARRERAAGLALLLAVLSKPVGATVALALAFDRRRDVGSRVQLVAAAAAGIALTLTVYALLLGDVGTPARFMNSYGRLAGGAEPILEWTRSYFADWLNASLIPHAWPLAVIGVVTVAMASGGNGMLRLSAAAISVCASCIVVSSRTDSALSLRFFWPLEIVVLALSVIGAFGCAAAGARVRPVILRAAMAASLLLLVTDLSRIAASCEARYITHFERGSRAILPFLDDLEGSLAARGVVNVPLGLQPLAIWRLRLGATPERVEAAEVRSLGHAVARDAPAWLLLLPNHYETVVGAQWVKDTLGCGFRIAAKPTAAALLLEHAPNARCDVRHASLGVHPGTARGSPTQPSCPPRGGDAGAHRDRGEDGPLRHV